MCKYCEHLESLFYNRDICKSVVQEVYIEPDKTMTVAIISADPECDDYSGASIEIDYCPKCGEALRPSDRKTLTGWIPVEERLPLACEYEAKSLDGTEYYLRMEVAMMTDTLEYQIAYYDGFKWFNRSGNKLSGVVAWKVHQPYRPEE